MIWIIFGIAILLILLLIFIVFVRRKTVIDYYSWFWIGILWVVIGIIFGNNILMVMGLIFMFFSLINKKKWRKNHKEKLKKLSKEDKKARVWIVLILAILVILGIALLIIIENKVSNIDKQKAIDIASKSECVSEGALTDNIYYNENTKTWWIDLNIKREGCSPACVVYETGYAEINWRCTGLVQ
jgi:formate hydrogenlyase subunit 3/multisubunit Na+/H+ antiporter MnhD subunit